MFFGGGLIESLSLFRYSIDARGYHRSEIENAATTCVSCVQPATLRFNGMTAEGNLQCGIQSLRAPIVENSIEPDLGMGKTGESKCASMRAGWTEYSIPANGEGIEHKAACETHGRLARLWVGKA